MLCAGTVMFVTSYSQRQEGLTFKLDSDVLVLQYFVCWRLHFCLGQFMWFLYSVKFQIPVCPYCSSLKLFAESTAIDGTGKNLLFDF